MSPNVTWVCDGCMRTVVASEIAVWADLEHVLCRDCDQHLRDPESSSDS